VGVIRKISIGPDYKSGAMHYLTGQQILNGSHEIHLIRFSQNNNSIEVWITNNKEVILWKEFSNTVPISIEYNINFE